MSQYLIQRRTHRGADWKTIAYLPTLCDAKLSLSTLQETATKVIAPNAEFRIRYRNKTLYATADAMPWTEFFSNA